MISKTVHYPVLINPCQRLYCVGIMTIRTNIIQIILYVIVKMALNDILRDPFLINEIYQMNVLKQDYDTNKVVLIHGISFIKICIISS